MPSIIQLHDWPAADINELITESESEGFRFVVRAKEGWRAGVNRFSKDGEALFGVFADARLVAIAGINYESPGCGRLRRFYVCRAERRKGIGNQLLAHTLSFARDHYTSVVLRCDTKTADHFYRAQGFSHTASILGATHIIEIKKEPIRLL